MSDAMTRQDHTLGFEFGDEWSELSIAAALAVAHDFENAPIDGQQYRYNIGKGNLGRYADALLVQAVKVWMQHDLLSNATTESTEGASR